MLRSFIFKHFSTIAKTIKFVSFLESFEKEFTKSEAKTEAETSRYLLVFFYLSTTLVDHNFSCRLKNKYLSITKTTKILFNFGAKFFSQSFSEPNSLMHWDQWFGRIIMRCSSLFHIPIVEKKSGIFWLVWHY
jgi:hypothetical protein